MEEWFCSSRSSPLVVHPRSVGQVLDQSRCRKSRSTSKGKIDGHTEISFLKLDGRIRRSVLWPANYSPRRKVYGDRFQSSWSRGDLDQEPGQNACGQNDASRDAAESQCSPPSMALAKLAEFACTGRAGTQVVNPGRRLFKG